MIDQTTLVTYIIILFGFMFIPGPAIVLTIARASSSGTRVGIATGFGIAIGDLVHTALAVLGVSAIILTSALLFSAIKYLGAAYLIYLGVRAILEKSGPFPGMKTAKIKPKEAFTQAMIAELLNPKSALFFLAFLPQFVQPENGAVAAQLATLGVLFVVVGLISTLLFAIGAGSIGKFLRQNPMVLKWQGKVVGAVYCGLGVRLALQDR